jgi:hypothetical protein
MAFRIIRRMDDRDLRRAKMVKEKSLPIAKFAIWQIFLSICWADSRLRRDLCVDSHLHTSLTPSTCISTSTCDSHLTSALRSVDVCAWSFKIIAHSDTIKTLSVLHFSLSLQLQFKKLFFFLQGFPVTRARSNMYTNSIDIPLAEACWSFFVLKMLLLLQI